MVIFEATCATSIGVTTVLSPRISSRPKISSKPRLKQTKTIPTSLRPPRSGCDIRTHRTNRRGQGNVSESHRCRGRQPNLPPAGKRARCTRRNAQEHRDRYYFATRIDGAIIGITEKTSKGRSEKHSLPQASQTRLRIREVASIAWEAMQCLPHCSKEVENHPSRISSFVYKCWEVVRE